jgi:hypothetical protein
MKIIKKTLKNGLKVLIIPMQDNPTVTVLSLVETGSKYENKELNGISHFLEHMCFKGTLKRPKAIDISRELDSIGSQYNAFTGQEYTGYYAKGDAKHFKKIFDVVTDIYLNSTFPEAEIEKEKGVIIEEINMYEDMPARHVQDLVMELKTRGFTNEREAKLYFRLFCEPRPIQTYDAKVDAAYDEVFMDVLKEWSIYFPENQETLSYIVDTERAEANHLIVPGESLYNPFNRINNSALKDESDYTHPTPDPYEAKALKPQPQNPPGGNGGGGPPQPPQPPQPGTGPGPGNNGGGGPPGGGGGGGS